MRINFTKMNGVGNDFVVIDAINQRFDITKNTIKYLAHRNRGTVSYTHLRAHETQ